MILIKVQFLLGNWVQLSVCLEKKPKNVIKSLSFTWEGAVVVAMERVYYSQFTDAILF